MKLNSTVASPLACILSKNPLGWIQKPFLTVLMLLMAFVYAEAQPTMFKAAGTSGFSSVLGSTSSRKSQQIYLPGDLTGAVNGNITQIFFRWHSTAGTNNYTNFSIKMGQTTATVFNPSTTFFTGLSTVYGPGNHTIVTTGLTSGDWFGWALDVPFNYDPTQTLIVEIEYDNPSTISPAMTVRTTTVSAKRVISSTFQAGTGSTNTAWPDIGFTVVAPPANDAGVVAISSPVSQTSTGIQDITVSIRNFGTAVLDDVDITYDVNGGTPVTQSFSNLALASGAISNPITLGSFNFNQLGKYVVTASTSDPNGVADAIPANDAFTATVSICDPLSGNYTIDQTAPFSVGTTFTSFADALEFLTFCGISGPVTFNVINGPYAEQVTVPTIIGVSSINTITFNGNGQTITHDGTGTGGRSTVLLDGAQYVSFNDFVINATGGTTGYGVHLTNGASNNSISNSTINITSTNTTQNNTAGIAASGSLTSVTTAGTGIDNNTIHGNTINGGYQCIIFTGPLQSGNIISDNIVIDPYLNGIQITGNQLTEISGNNISRPTRSAASALSAGTSGILLSTGTIKTNVSNNRIHGMYDGMQSATTASINGISILTGTTATIGDENLIYNNLIYNMRSNSIVNGITQTASPYQKIYHNTIVLDHVSSTATGVTRGYVQTTNADGIEFMNNIVYITRGGTGVRAGIALITGGSTVTSNNNVIYVTPATANFNVGLLVTIAHQTLSSWTTASLQDANSTDADPLFTDAANLNFIPTSAAVNNIGATIGISADINGDPRNLSAPDPGAYEWTAEGLDAGISYVAPSLPTTTGLHSIVVNIANTKTTTINTVELQYSDGVITITENFTGLNLAGGANVDLTFAVQYNVTHPAQFTVSILNVNGISDDEAFNDSVTLILCVAFSGTYTINQGAPTDLSPGIANFNSFNDLSNYLSNCGIGGHLVVNVVPNSGPYIEQVVFQNISGLSSASTVTINGNNNTVTFLTTSADRHVIRLANLSDFIINDLRIERDINAGLNFFGIHIFSTGNDITINNVTVDMTGATQTSGVTGILAGNSLTSNLDAGSFSHLTISGNTIIGGAFGIAMNGASASFISGNAITGTLGNGISIRSNSGGAVTGNNIHFTAGNGINLGLSANINSLIEKNFISVTNSTNSGTLTGITVGGGSSANPNRYENNVIWNMNAPLASIIGIQISGGGSAQQLYFNTIILDDQNSTGLRSLAYVEGSLNTNSTLKNNIFYVTRPSSNYGAAIALTSTANVLSAVTSDNNVFYTPGTETYVAVRQGTVAANPPTNIYEDLATWNTASTQDAASFETDPFFETGTAIPTSGIINDGGVNIAGITTDITGGPRPDPPATSPDPGAYEFTPAGNDAAISGFDLALPSCGTIDIDVVLSNAGSDVLNTVDIEWFVNGASQGSQNYTGLNLAAGANVTITVGTQALLANTLYEFTATASNPNGSTDANPVNDSFTKSGVRAGLSGTLFTIDQNAPVSGTNFTSFQSFANDLATYGVCGPVFATVMNGPYTEQVEFTSIPGSSFTNTVTLDGNLQELNFNPTSSANDHIIKLDGVNYFVIENITVKSTNANNGRGIFITNGASKILLQNNIVEVTKTNSGSTAFPIIASGANWLLNGTLSDSIAIIGNTIIGGYVGIQFTGENTSPITNVLMSGNLIQDQYINGIQTNSMTGFVVSGNEITRPTRLNSDNYYGIHLNFRSNNFLTEKNKIHSLQNSGMALTHLAGGIRISGTSVAPSTGTISNNLIFNLTNTSTQYGINDEAWGNGTLINIYHNTIALNDVTMGGSATTTAIGITASSTPAGTHNLQNNVLNIARGGTGTKRLLDVTSASAILSSNYNVFWFGTSDGTLQVARVATNLYPTLPDWQVTGNDLNSVYADPMFVDPSIGNYQPSNSVTSGTLMNTSQVGGITDDINNVLRSVNPAPGAFEWSAFCEAPPTAGIATLSNPPVCYGQSASISVSGTSTGIGLIQQWESSIDGITYTAMPGANNTSLTSDPLTETTHFRFAVTCDGVTTYSNVIEVVIYALFPVISSTESMPLCEGEFTTLSTQYQAVDGYQFSWNGGLFTSESITVDVAGTYTCIAIAPNGCESALVTFDLEVSTIFADVLEIIDASCFGGSDGSLEIEALGAILEPQSIIYFGPFDYAVDGGALQSSPLFTGLAAGTYTFEVHDPTTGCVLYIPATVGEPAPLVAGPITVNSNVSCNGGMDGSATASASGGTGSYTFDWLTPIPKTGETNDEIPAGTWTVVVTDENGCTATTEVTITEPDELFADLGSDMIIPWGTANGYTVNGCASITASVTGGTEPYTYLWSTGATTNPLNVCYSRDTIITFTVTLTDVNGCTATGSVTYTWANIDCSNNSNGTKVTICHVPPGNPGNCKTICIAVSAASGLFTASPASYLGPCQSTCPTARVSAPEITETLRINLFPNPTSGKVTVDYMSDHTPVTSIVVMDIQGRVMQTLPVANELEFARDVDLGNLENGLYMINIMNEQKIISSSRVVKTQ